MQTDVLILGGGCGGLETAIELRRQVPDALITLVNPSAYLVYRPWLIYLPAQHRCFEHLQVSLAQAATTYQLRLGTDTVRHLDLGHHQAQLALSEPIHLAGCRRVRPKRLLIFCRVRARPHSGEVNNAAPYSQPKGLGGR